MNKKETIKELLDEYCNNVRVRAIELIEPNRKSDIVLKRHLIMYLLRQAGIFSFGEIAAIFQRDHATVIHACKSISNRMDTGDEDLLNLLQELSLKL